MCGILVGFQAANRDAIDRGREMIRRRGPDHACEVKLDRTSQFVSTLFASCLYLQGETPQPLQDDGGHVLCFNGELYCEAIPNGVSDTKFLFDKLVQLENNQMRIDWLSTVEGEWALVFYCMQTRSLLFGRDGLGRRSLMVAHCNNNIQCISSTSIPGTETMWHWTELPCSCMFQLVESEVYLIKRLPRSNKLRNIFPTSSLSLPTWERFLFALDNATRRRLHKHTLRSGSAAILFSGGIDSVLLAVCAHRVLPKDQSIQLVNVSFHGSEAPDRIAAELSLVELERAFPQRTFVLTRVNVTLEQVKHEERDILNHMFPKQTVMDFNLSCVLWFGSGYSNNNTRVLLSGIGADELCGGYSRHKQRYKMEGVIGLRNELEMDVNRLWLRNFGRDDRAVAAHGKELRMPFVDSEVMQVVHTSPIEDLMSFESQGGGDKLVLRRIMHELGLGETAERVKRAAQFGSRIAKLIRPEAHGTDEFLLGSTLL